MNIIEEIMDRLGNDGRARFPFGTFRVHKRKGSRYKDLQTGELKEVGEHTVIFFRASKTLRRAVKQRYDR